MIEHPSVREKGVQGKVSLGFGGPTDAGDAGGIGEAAGATSDTGSVLRYAAGWSNLERSV